MTRVINCRPIYGAGKNFNSESALSEYILNLAKAQQLYINNNPAAKAAGN